MNSDLVEMVEYSFGSVWALELLLLLHRNPDRAWPTEDLVRELRSSSVVVTESIERLVASGLVLVDGDMVRYGVVSPEQDVLVRQLDETYRTKPAAIRRMIVQGPAEKLKSFSDAFKLKPG
jgi:hypothetical protein